MPEGIGSDFPAGIPEDWGIVAVFGGAYRRKDMLVARELVLHLERSDCVDQFI